MLPTIATGNVASAIGGGYEVANSCRFNDGDSAYMHKTPGSAGNQITFTISLWCKRGALGTKQTLFSAVNDANNETECHFETDDTLNFRDNEGGSFQIQKRTTQVFRDCSAWYHLVFSSVSGTQKIWVNGVEVTSWTTDTNGTGTATWNDDNVMTVGAKNDGSSPQDYFDGYIAEFVSIDGLTLTPTSFGEFDEDSPTIWKPIDVSGLTFGTNGFYLDFEDSSNLGNDANGGTDLTEVNLAATDQTTDTPTNNFCTLNPLTTNNSSYTFAEGNTKATSSTSWLGSVGTIAMGSGKWYWEVSYGAGNFGSGIGQLLNDATETIKLSTANEGYSSKYSRGYEYVVNGGYSRRINNDSHSTYGSVPSGDDIIMIAFDADNGIIWTGENGTWNASATEGEIEAGTTTNAMYSSINMDQPYLPTASIESGNLSYNFGNPAYANSSDAADADGYGAFEFAPPSGYFALCTKNLAEYG